MKKIIKFRRPWFAFRDNFFDHFSYWGVGLTIGNGQETEFTSPGSWSHGYHKEDQQLTGLRDKNGEDIYEGDIVKNKLTSMITVVMLGECKRYSYHGWYLHNEELGYTSQFVEDDLLEVIGNIYETPELLKP